jgi:hypothetical protein
LQPTDAKILEPAFGWREVPVAVLALLAPLAATGLAVYTAMV